MKKIILLLIITFTLLTIIAEPLPSFYTRYDQMKAIMDSLAYEYPSLIRVDSLGVSDTEQIPIWGAKLSNNVNERKDVPRILIIGSLHAEEVIGNQIAMQFMKDVIINNNQAPYQNWLNELEIWIVPNMNPEGLDVVMAGSDFTYRKNKKDNNNNGIFDFVSGQGGDIDGVDLNRNWDVNWVHGDTLYSTNGYELYDYYRGEYPFSEGENKAIRDLAYREQFTYAIVWHSSRTGNLSEKVYIPFKFKNLESRQAPDYDINYAVGLGVASNIQKYNSSSFYQALPASGRKGDSHVWFYSELGTIKLLIECGTENIQPNENILNDTVQRCLNGQAWMFNRALSTGSLDIARGMLTGNVYDAVSGDPLRAKIVVHNRESDALKPRYSNEEHGRFWRPLLQGAYTFSVMKKGYQTETLNVVVPNSGWRYREINLQPLQAITLNLHIHSDGNPVNAKITLTDPSEEDDVYTTNDGNISINTFVGTRTLTIITENGVPWQQEIEFDNSKSIDINVSTVEILFEEDFSNDLSQWIVNGEDWEIVTHNDKTFLTDSWGGYGFYEIACDVDITTAEPIAIPQDNETYILYEQHLYTEWEHDFVSISASTDNENWIVLYEKAGKYDYWHKNLVSLNQFAGESIYLKFRLKDDESAPLYDLTDPGWSLDNIKIISGDTSSIITSNNDIVAIQSIIKLKQNYPNPFNPETNLAFEIKNYSFDKAMIDIFNIKGQKVNSFDLNDNDIQKGYIVWKAENLSSGIYFYRLSIDNKTISTKKALLLK
ncbi:MAG: M14 family zinc carboxypeptidase [Candidatus Pacebacteria bacterium]|nr:M14 family zinc carboxypeptidase [Candidatus Paceibacterota bacterium]